MISIFISSDAPLDLKIKASMISDMFSIVGESLSPSLFAHKKSVNAWVLGKEECQGFGLATTPE